MRTVTLCSLFHLFNAHHLAGEYGARCPSYNKSNQININLFLLLLPDSLLTWEYMIKCCISVRNRGTRFSNSVCSDALIPISLKRSETIPFNFLYCSFSLCFNKAYSSSTLGFPNRPICLFLLSSRFCNESLAFVSL